MSMFMMSILSLVVTYGLVILTLYFVIKAAVKAALKAAHADKIARINGVRLRKEREATDANDVIKLRDLGILSEDELEGAAGMYQKAKEQEERRKEYFKYEKVLAELKTIGYLNEEQYMIKCDALKKHCGID